MYMYIYKHIALIHVIPPLPTTTPWAIIMSACRKHWSTITPPVATRNCRVTSATIAQHSMRLAIVEWAREYTAFRNFDLVENR